MAPSGVVGSWPLNQASTCCGGIAWVSSCFSAAAWMRPLRGQPHRSLRAWSSSKNDIRSGVESIIAHSTSFLAAGSLSESLSARARPVSPAWAASMADFRVASSSADSGLGRARGGVCAGASAPDGALARIWVAFWASATPKARTEAAPHNTLRSFNLNDPLRPGDCVGHARPSRMVAARARAAILSARTCAPQLLAAKDHGLLLAWPTPRSRAPSRR